MLKTRDELIAYRAAAKRAFDAQPEKILVCAGTGCVAGGALQIFARLKELME